MPAPVPGTGPNPGIYQVQLVSIEHPQDTVGRLTVNPVSNNGDINVTLDSATVPNMTFFLKFCPFGKFNQDCFNVGNFKSDSNGNVNASVQFSKGGTWAGVFYISKDDSTSNPQSDSFWVTEPSAQTGNFNEGQNYRVALRPQASVRGGIGRPTSEAPLSSGFISISGDMLHAEVHGAARNTSYIVDFCGNGGFTSDCNSYGSAGAFTTDSSGNGSVDVKVFSADSEVFFVDKMDTSGAGYITAFAVQ